MDLEETEAWNREEKQGGIMRKQKRTANDAVAALSSPEELYAAADDLGIEHSEVAAAIGFLLGCKERGELRIVGTNLTMETKDRQRAERFARYADILERVFAYAKYGRG